MVCKSILKERELLSLPNLGMKTGRAGLPSKAVSVEDLGLCSPLCKTRQATDRARLWFAGMICVVNLRC